MENQPVPPYQATAPGSTQPMIYAAENEKPVVQQTLAHPQTMSNQPNGHDFIEPVNIEYVY